MSRELLLTLSVLALLLSVAAFAGWRGARPPDLRRGPRLVPWRALMLLAAFGAFLAIVHLLNVLGVETGRR